MTAAREERGPRTKPFPVRLTDDERAQLERRAGSMAVGSYVKCVLFAEGDKRSNHRSRAPVKDHAALASMLAQLGASRSAEWLAMLAGAARSGTLTVDEETTMKLDRACHDVLVIRLLLMQALGIQVTDDADDGGADVGVGRDDDVDHRHDHDRGIVSR
ncbi:hypothetical protein [Aurantimonas marianensis]|uniref:Uncharacterized protein n=1 Tax=Aurantimonas marianensis TaxID=2920428 RepID=A0A9X2HC44_9HYPH|nr:hypothetical protein [Aurantimonas marianensis]MCP3054934.1 hypothetical protein [Aurantimonas marianensis]